MIASVDQHPAPKRLAVGSDVYTAMHKALTTRLAELEAQCDLAFSTDPFWRVRRLSGLSLAMQGGSRRPLPVSIARQAGSRCSESMDNAANGA